MSKFTLRVPGLLLLSILIGFAFAASASAATFYVSPTGSNTNCSTIQTIGTPALTMQFAKNCMSGGDTMTLLIGTFTESVEGWSSTIPSGSAGAPTIIRANSPGNAIVKPNAGSHTHIFLIENTTTPQQYITFDGLVVDAFNMAGNPFKVVFGNNIRIINSELRYGGTALLLGGSFNEVSNSKMHDAGFSPGFPCNNPAICGAYGVYNVGDHNLIDRNEFYNNSGYGIHVYNGDPKVRTDGTIVRNNRVHNNCLVQGNCGGIIVSSGDNLIVHNNVVWNNPGGITMGGGSGNAAYNNTMYNNTVTAMDVQPGASPIIRNNILYGSSITVADNGSGTYSNNLCGPSRGTGCAIVGNPLFVDPTNADFRVQAGSPAIDAGAALGAPYNVDIVGTSRPQPAVGLYDIGAYEFVSGGISTPPPPPPPSGAGLQRNGRWLTYNGQNNIYFVGTDYQSLVTNEPNYISVLDTLAQYRLNKLRIWIYPWFASPTNGIYPWTYTGGKWNLDQFNNAYFTNLQNVAAAAQQRGIILEVSIFSHYADIFANPTVQYAYNKAYNVNGVFSGGSSGNFSSDFYYIGQYGMPSQGELSSTGHNLLYYQQALVDKVVNTLKPYTNVYFEIANEFPGDFTTCPIGQLYPWQRYFADRVKFLYPSAIVTAHSQNIACGDPNLGAQYFWDYPTVDVLNFHYYEENPSNISLNLHPMQLKNKVLQSNESYMANDPNHIDGTTREAWGFFTGGGYYDFYWGQTSFGSPEWIAAANRFKALHDIADTVPWWTMSPVDSAGNEYDTLVTQGPGASGWQVLTNPGSSYVAYFWGTPSNTAAKINLPSGSYNYKWYDVRNATVLAQGTVTGGGIATINAPSASSWNGNAGAALTILLTSTPPPPPPPPPPPSSGWTFCASEGQQCSFSGTKEVRFGANSVYVSGSFSGGTLCSNSIFEDPLYGVAKSCEYRDLVSPSPSTKFNLNDRAYVNSSPLNVRSAPNTSGAVLGQEALNNQGTVTTLSSYDGTNFWRLVNYDDGLFRMVF
jgi:parallel beta-helix repeat protein